MTDATIAKLDTDFAKHPVLVAGPAQEADIAALEATVGFPLPADYRAFVKRYGGAIVGAYSVFGIGVSDAMGDDEASAMQVTERFRAQRWPGTETTLVISMDQAGNAVTLDANGCVHRFDHDSGATEQLAVSFENFVVNWCLKACMGNITKEMLVGNWHIIRTERGPAPAGFESESAIVRFTQDGHHYVEYPNSTTIKVLKLRYEVTPRGVFVTSKIGPGSERLIEQESNDVLVVTGADGLRDWIKRVTGPEVEGPETRPM